MKEYAVSDLSKALGARSAGFSVRAIGKQLGIPKSVIGRWVKDPDLWRQKMEFKQVSREMKGSSPLEIVKFQRFKKRILKTPVGDQRKLSVSYDTETGGWSVESV